MKLFLLFICTSMVIGSVWGQKSVRSYIVPMIGMAVLIAIGYFAFRMT